jgi:hypothetical protein
VLPELVSLAEIGIKEVRAKVLLRVRPDNARAILVHSLDTGAEHTEILHSLTRTSC